MRSDRRIFAWISYIVLGAILVVLGVMEIVYIVNIKVAT